MARRPPAGGPPPRGPERHTSVSESAVDAPVTSPASSWPTADASGGMPATPRPSDEHPASIRVRKKRSSSRSARAKKLAKRLGYTALVVALLASLALVVVLIVAPHHLF
ncbi:MULTISPECIES: hypothetical protein [unclassified Rathayibacter]|uniref:hypothetical protein n=1 Tax=unclassified Rathayibacter TaxID=2609250 RepID=UPI001E41B57A|nr:MULTISPECIES: hypothetical protein [unclassified Rathayibacter]